MRDAISSVDTSDAFAPSETCDTTFSSTLDGARFTKLEAPCSISAADLAKNGIAVKATVSIDRPGIGPLSLDWNCVEPDPESGLFVWITVTGSNQSYCEICELGLCLPTVKISTPMVGSYDQQWTWNGKNWNGPSDTGNGPGPAFPPGTYVITVQASGDVVETADASADASTSRPFKLSATRTITIR